MPGSLLFYYWYDAAGNPIPPLLGIYPPMVVCNYLHHPEQNCKYGILYPGGYYQCLSAWHLEYIGSGVACGRQLDACVAAVGTAGVESNGATYSMVDCTSQYVDCSTHNMIRSEGTTCLPTAAISAFVEPTNNPSAAIATGGGLLPGLGLRPVPEDVPMTTDAQETTSETASETASETSSETDPQLNADIDAEAESTETDDPRNVSEPGGVWSSP
jgi:hypothetical protein